MEIPLKTLQQIAHQHGITILAQPRLKGLILDMMPTADRKYINVLKRAIDEKIGLRLLEMQHDEPAVRQIKVNTLKEKFKNDNAFDDTAFYIVDCFLHALGWSHLETDIILPFKEIKIGDQIWADRNLDVSHFRNGDQIPEARTDEEWKKAGENKQPAWCYYDNDPENGKIYGKLYNWYAVNDPRGLAPEGWHVSTDDDWKILEGIVDSEYKVNDIEWDNDTDLRGFDVGLKMKSKIGWNGAGNGTDDYGIAILPSGFREIDGIFDRIGYDAYFWSAIENSNSSYFAIARVIYHELNLVGRFDFGMELGFSVRCLKA